MKKMINYAPYVLGLAYTFFLMMFSFDVFVPEYTLGEMIIGFIMHNLPVFVIWIILIIAWKRAWFGVYGFLFVAIFYGLLIGMNMRDDLEYLWVGLLSIAGPSILISLLFLLKIKKGS